MKTQLDMDKIARALGAERREKMTAMKPAESRDYGTVPAAWQQYS